MDGVKATLLQACQIHNKRSIPEKGPIGPSKNWGDGGEDLYVLSILEIVTKGKKTHGRMTVRTHHSLRVCEKRGEQKEKGETKESTLTQKCQQRTRKTRGASAGILKAQVQNIKKKRGGLKKGVNVPISWSYWLRAVNTNLGRTRAEKN